MRLISKAVRVRCTHAFNHFTLSTHVGSRRESTNDDSAACVGRIVNAYVDARCNARVEIVTFTFAEHIADIRAWFRSGCDIGMLTVTCL